MARVKRSLVSVMSGLDSAYDQALEKAKDPMMTTAGNPLVEDNYQQGQEDRIVRVNMERLMQDAHNRRGPNGGVYSAIMDQRFQQ